MPQAGVAPDQKLVTELKVSGHLMTLDRGLFCVFHAQGSAVADPQTGLPGVRITQPPMQDRSRVSISSFNEDGWIGAAGSAALVRVNEGPSQLLVTIYQNGSGQHEAPKLQVMRLGDVAGASTAVPAQAPAAGEPAAAAAPVVPAGAAKPADAQAVQVPDEKAEVAAHVQRRGDRLGKLGEWMGEPGSQSWIEGFAIAPNRLVGPEDIEYQAVLGKGWLSPWSEGGQYCGSRGMALPILGLRVRLKGRAVQTHSLRVSATFTDGSRIGPLSDTETAEAESLAPLEAFRIEILPHDAAGDLDADDAEDDEDQEVPAAAGVPVQPAAGPQDVPALARAAVSLARKALSAATGPGKPAPANLAPASPAPATTVVARNAPATTASARTETAPLASAKTAMPARPASRPVSTPAGKPVPRKPAGPTRR